MANNNILVPIDGSDTSLSALKQAAILVNALGSKLIVISIVEENPFVNADFYYFGADSSTMKEYFDEACKNAKAALLAAQKLCEDLGVNDAEIKMIKGEVSATTILKTAEELNSNLIIMGSHGRKGVQKLALGSVAEDILLHSPLPVLIVKQ
ncbi:universal stress protein [Acinetobacter sp. ANC 4635]|uniref:universal stress protein n=1 Tax=Acinetobacter sp. ANC 4635 TaxID=2529846 RepID=UPI00103F9395|nr:universal stress protein [Acinetobacter sp. ANC 4635]TCB24436.1 universal stress protein [Acinetobacter sp. ANC 4635]